MATQLPDLDTRGVVTIHLTCTHASLAVRLGLRGCRISRRPMQILGEILQGAARFHSMCGKTCTCKYSFSTIPIHLALMRSFKESNSIPRHRTPMPKPMFHTVSTAAQSKSTSQPATVHYGPPRSRIPSPIPRNGGVSNLPRFPRYCFSGC